MAQGGVFNTTHTATIKNLELPQFATNWIEEYEMHLSEKNKADQNNFIFGTHFLQAIGMEILSSGKMLAWDDIDVEILYRT